MPASLLRSLRLFLLRWHRRLGVVLALLLVGLAVTGIALNHSVGWGLDRTVAPGWVQQVYRDGPVQFESYRAAGVWVSYNGRGTLYVQGREVGYCETPFGGAVASNGEIVAACASGLLLATPAGELIERIDLGWQIPGPVLAIGLANEQPVLRTAEGNVALDMDTLSASGGVSGEVAWARVGRPDAELVALLETLSQGEGVSWERALLDLHSGKFFGRFGVLAADLAAIGLILLGASGVWVWTTKPGRFRRR